MANAAPKLSIVNVGYRSTNFWVLSVGRARFLVDLGWWGMFGALEKELRRKDIPLAEVTHGFATHYHGDHAGAAQDLKNAGMKLVVTPEQVPHVAGLTRWAKPENGYTVIEERDNLVVPIGESRAFLKTCGIDGQFVHTPGHSDDSVSLLLDTGEAFTGDLTWPEMVGAENPDVVRASWARLRELGAKSVLAGHGPVRPMPNG